MPKRSILIRATLFAEVASALVLIEVGLFTHPGMIVVPFFIMAFVALQRVDYAAGESQHLSFDPREFFLSLIVPKKYSVFGLCKRQKTIKSFVWPLNLVRLVCTIVIVAVLLGGSCRACPSLKHECEFLKCRRGFLCTKIGSGTYKIWTTMSHHDEECWLSAKYAEGGPHLKLLDSTLVCPGTRPSQGASFIPATAITEKTTWTVFPAQDTNSSSLCDKEAGIIPGMLKAGCETETFDPGYYQYCLHENPLFPGICNARFVLCSSVRMTNLTNVLALLYMLAPLCWFGLVIVLHFAEHTEGMMSVPEDKALRSAIKARSRQLEQELQSGKHHSSLWWDRRAFEFKILFFAIDIILDAGSCINFILADRYIFAACQLVTWIRCLHDIMDCIKNKMGGCEPVGWVKPQWNVQSIIS